MPKTKAEKAAYKKQWRLDNKERIAAYDKQYKLDNKEKIAARDKQYRLDNKEKKKQYYLSNKERIIANQNQYNIKNHKARILYGWKRQGLIHDDYDAVYDEYLLATNCNICDVLLTTGKVCKTQKVMDHCHSTGEFRQFLCSGCNLHLID